MMKRLILAAVVAQMASGQSGQGIPMATAEGNVVLIVDRIYQETVGHMKLPSSILEGSIRNETPFTLSYVRFQVVAYDESGTDVKMCDPYNLGSLCEFSVLHQIASGQTVTLTRSSGTFTPNRRVPKGHKIVGVEYRIIDAPFFIKIKYTVRSEPITNDKLTINSAFGVRGIALEFQNTSSDVIEVAWDQSVYIDQEGHSSRLIRGNVRLADKDRPQPNTVIPPGAKLQETVFPVDRILQSPDPDGHLFQSWLFPDIVTSRTEAEHLKSLGGKEVRVFLRLLVNDRKENLTIPFKVANVEY
jgi:hypothetical protein